MKNSKFLKRFLAFVLSAAMVLTYMPTSMIAFAEDEAAEAASSEPKAAAAEEVKSEPAPAPKVEEPAPAPAAEEPAAAPAAEESTPAASEEAVAAEETSDAAEETAPAETAEAVTEEQAVDPEEKEEEPEYPADTFKGSAGGVSVVIDAPEGALPEGTKMVVKAVSADSVQSAVEDAIGAEVAKIKAVDISFHYDGKEIEPKKAVKVHMNASGMANEGNQSIVHIADNGSAEVVTEKVSNGNAAFKSADFSVYIVAEEDIQDPDENAIATYEFYVNDTLKQTQHVKTGDKLVDPGDLAGNGADIVFLGWYAGDNKINFDESVTVEKTATIRVDAKVQKTYYVTFLGEKKNNKRPVAAVKTVTVTGDEAGSIDPSEVDVTPEKDTSVFKGWSTTDGGDPVEGNVEVKKNMNLYAVIVHANWIRFDENDGGAGGGASYTAPVAVEDGKAAETAKPADPTRKGYDFGGWYTDEDCKTAFDWDQTISENITLYAKWTPKENTKYTVIIWKQKVTDDKNADDSAKTYDYEEHKVLDGKTDATITEDMYSDYTGKSYTGFHYDRVEYDQKTIDGGNKIRAKGDTVINVYYDRNLNSLIYYRQSYGSWIEDTSNPKMTGLYGQTLAQNGYEWPDDYDWYESPGPVGPGNTHITFLDAFKNANTEYKLYRHSESSGYYYIRHYKQNIDGSYPDNPANSTRSNGGTWHFSDKYEGFTVSQYRVGRYGNWYKAGSSAYFDDNLYIRYERNNYSLSFQDDSGRITDDELAAMKADKIPYEKSLSSYQPSSPKKGDVRDHYVFQGWFEDAAGTKAFDWSSTMPAANKVVYAKWTPERYHITLKPNGGTLVDGQAEEFDLDYQDVVNQSSLEQTTRVEGDKVFELVGWFDEDTGSAYSYPKVDKDTTLVAKWRFPGLVQIKYDAADHGSGAPEDEYMYATDSDVVVGRPPETIEDGYEFIGWKIDGEGTTYYHNNTFTLNENIIKDYDKETKTGTVTLVAQYSKKGEGPFEKTYIRWFKNDGSDCFHVDTLESPTGDVKDSTLLVNEAVDIQSAPTRTGYIFLGWAKVDDTGSGISKTQDLKESDLLIKYEDGAYVSAISGEACDEVAADNDRKFEAMFAVWKEIDKLSYDANGGSGSMDPTYDNDGDGKVEVAANSFTRTGYDFTGWNTQADGKGTAVAAGSEFTLTSGNDVVYAQWKAKEYTVEFAIENTNGKLSYGGSDNLSGYTATVPYGTETPNVVPKPKAGYSFGGWKKSTADDAIQQELDPTVTEDVKYTATWTANTNTKYTVEFWYQNASGVYELKDSVERTGTTGATAQTTDEDTAEKDGYHLDMGNCKLSGTIAGDGSLVLKVSFRPQYTITYLAGDHGKVPDPAGVDKDKVTYGGKYYGDYTPGTGVKGNPDDGYEFVGWDPEPAAKVTGDATYTAKWKAKDVGYKVEFYYQADGEYPETATSSEDRTGKTDASVEVTADDKKPTKDGYVLDESKSDAWTGKVKADGSLVLKVYFKQQFTVTFDANGHGTAPDAQTVDAGKTATKPTDPSESGFVFGGWFTDAECTTEYDFSTPVKSDMTLYAKWTEAGTATITYDLNGGTYNGSTANIEENYKIGEVISIHAAPEREGYVFSYWQGSAYQPGDSYTVEGDHTFTAVWVAIEETDDDSDKSDKTDKSKGVKTGDEADLAGWLMLMLIAGAGTGYIALGRKREED